MTTERLRETLSESIEREVLVSCIPSFSGTLANIKYKTTTIGGEIPHSDILDKIRTATSLLRYSGSALSNTEIKEIVADKINPLMRQINAAKTREDAIQILVANQSIAEEIMKYVR